MKKIDLKLENIEFSTDDMVKFLIKKGFKIEIHETNSGISFGNGIIKSKSDKLYAIPIDDTFDVKKHKQIEETFKKVLLNDYKNFLLNL
jgi:hypothetical protein